VLADLRVGHAGVGGGFGTRETGVLHGAGGAHPLSDNGGRFAGFLRAKIVNGERRGFDVEIDTIKERAADAGAVALHL